MLALVGVVVAVFALCVYLFRDREAQNSVEAWAGGLMVALVLWGVVAAFVGVVFLLA